MIDIYVISHLFYSLELDPDLVMPGLAQDGQQAAGAEAGQVASLTSTNNFIVSVVSFEMYFN